MTIQNCARQGVVRIKNVSGSSYALEELNLTLGVNEEIDLLDRALPNHYTEWDAANLLVTSLVSAKLNQDIVAGGIEVLENSQMALAL